MVRFPSAKTTKLTLILFVAVVLRIAAAIYLGDSVVSLPGTADQVSYHTLALRVLDGHGFTFGEAWWPVTAAGEPTAHWSFLYTLYLAGVYALVGVHPLAARLIQAVIVGILHPYLAYRLTDQVLHASDVQVNVGGTEQRSRFGIPGAVVEYAPLLAALVTAVYAYFVYYAATLMTEPFYITAVLASISLAITLATRSPQPADRKLALVFGGALAVAVLLRQLFLLMVPFLLLWLIVVAYRRYASLRVLSSVSIAIVVLVLAIVPATLYNYARFDRFVLLNTNAGYAFFLANHPFYGTDFIPASEMDNTYGDLIPTELRQLDEAALDRELLKRGLEFVVEEPGRYIRLSISRIPLYFEFLPSASSGRLSNIARVGSFGLFLPFMLYGLAYPLILAYRSQDKSFYRYLSPALVLFYLFIAIYAGIHILSWVQVRYRLPVDAVLVVFAAIAIADLMWSIRNIMWSKTQSNESALGNEYVTK